MIRRLWCRTARYFIVAAFATAILTTSTGVFAQKLVPQDASIDWRGANDAVGQFKRGHADVLKWEDAKQRDVGKSAEPPASLVLMNADAAIRRAWLAHLDLAHTLAVLSPEIVDRVAAGQWTDFDPGWRRRAPELDELLDVAAATRKSWLQAVAARQTVKRWQDALVAAESAAELAARMARIGNWSKLQEVRVQIALNAARMDLRRAEYAQVSAQAELLGTLRLTGVHTSIELPDNLPELPAGARSGAVVQQRLEAVAAELPRAERLRATAGVVVASAAYRASHDIALRTSENLKLQEFVVEETTLRYNGMLASVWDVLGEARNRAQASAEAIDALRDFWIADSDLQHVLLGGVPDRFISLGGGSKDSAAAAH